MTAPHAGEGHLCISISDAYAKMQEQMSGLMSETVYPLKEVLKKKLKELEEKLLEVHNRKQSIEDDTRSFFQGIRHRLNAVVNPKDSLLQSNLKQIKVTSLHTLFTYLSLYISIYISLSLLPPHSFLLRPNSVKSSRSLASSPLYPVPSSANLHRLLSRLVPLLSLH